MDGSENLKTAASPNSEESDLDRKTSSSKSDDGVQRAGTPGPMPKYIYSKVSLYL